MMSEPGRHTAPIPILDIPVPDAGVSVRTAPTPTLVLPIPQWEDPPVQAVPPTVDWTRHEQVGDQLQVRLTDLESWLHLREKYGSPNNLIALINSDLVILGRGVPLPYVEDLS